MEEWRDVVGYEKLYAVSNLGRVRSKNRVVQTKRGRWRYRGRILRPGRMSTGYVSVAVGRGNSVMVQWLVLEAFTGPRPERHDADHINHIRDDNRLSNLRWLCRTVNRLYLGRWIDKYGGPPCL